MGHLYISYSPKDGGYVHNLQEALKKRGFDIWIDDRAGYGAHSVKAIQERLDACIALIVVVSENSFESEWVQYEIAHAKRKEIPFFPILLGGDPWLSVEATLYVNLSDGSLPPEKFYQRLAAVAAQSQKEQSGLSKDAAVSAQSGKALGDGQIKPKRSRASRVITGIFVTLALLAVGICSLAIRAFTSTSRYPAYYRPTQVLYVFHNLPSTTMPRATQIAATRTVAAVLTAVRLSRMGRRIY